MSTVVRLKWNNLSTEALKWAAEHCPSYYVTSHAPTEFYERVRIDSNGNMNMSIGSTYVDCHFTDESDAIIFALRWL